MKQRHPVGSYLGLSLQTVADAGFVLCGSYLFLRILILEVDRLL